jgi:hypothetical protein
MATFRIPPAHRDGLGELLALDEDSKQRLLSALEDTGRALKPDDLSERASSLSKLPLETVSNIVAVLVSLNALRTHLDITADEVADQVCEALVQSSDKELTLTSENREQFRGYLAKLVAARSLVVSSKVVDVWSEHEHAFCSARIFTDLRPVFGGEQDDTLMATGVVHMLKLSYHEPNAIKEIYIALDDDDIIDLRDALDKASIRSEGLRALLQEAKISYFE